MDRLRASVLRKGRNMGLVGRQAIVVAITFWHRRRIARYLHQKGVPYVLGQKNSLIVHGEYGPLTSLITDLRHRFRYGYYYGFVVSSFSPDEAGYMIESV